MIDTQQETTPVVVLGLGLSALGTVRSLGRAGLHPYLVCPNGDLSGLTRWARGRVLRIPETDDPDVLADALGRHGLNGAILIPCTDEWSEVVAQLAAAPDRPFVTSAPDPAVVHLLVDKEAFAETVERLGVPYPRTLAVSDEASLSELNLNGLFLKPRQSQLFARRYHRKAFTFEGLEEARSAYRLVADAGLGAILQEYIPGPPTSHYFVDGFVDRNGRIAALFARQRIRMFPLDFGNSTLMVSVGLDQVPGAITSLNTLLTGIGYRGIFSAEFKRDQRDGIFKILEVNTRPWWFIEFATVCGVNVALLAYRDALGLDVPEIREYSRGVRCLLLPQDVRAYRALRRTKSLAFFPWLRSWLGARPSIFDKSDPLPALSLPIVIARRAARRF
jgi:predicted ATP-grasp superfamily ATP-dependent carboligase